MGRNSLAAPLVKRVFEIDPLNPVSNCFAAVYCLQKDKEKALPLFTEEIKHVGWNDYGFPWFMTNYYAMIDEKDESLKWLERAVEWGLINYPLLSEIDPIIENIRGEESFKKLMVRVKHEWENFEV